MFDSRNWNRVSRSRRDFPARFRSLRIKRSCRVVFTIIVGGRQWLLAERRLRPPSLDIRRVAVRCETLTAPDFVGRSGFTSRFEETSLVIFKNFARRPYAWEKFEYIALPAVKVNSSSRLSFVWLSSGHTAEFGRFERVFLQHSVCLRSSRYQVSFNLNLNYQLFYYICL